MNLPSSNNNISNTNPLLLKMIIDFYTKKLIEWNPVLIVTPAALERLNRQAESLRQHQLKRETNPVWNIPVKVLADGKSPTRFEVVLETTTT